MSLLERWKNLAEDWSSWARDPGHDFYFWHFNLPSLLRMVPPEAKRALDLGCGEGRVSRHLLRAGVDVVGLDISPYLVRKALDGDPPLRTILADGTDLPFRSGVFDLVVASMSLQDITDAPKAIGEASRVLEPGGVLCLSVVHPLSSWQAISSRPDSDHTSYFEERDYDENVYIGEKSIHLHSAHRTVSSYFLMLADAGLVCDYMAEPRPSAAMVQKYPGLADMRRNPRFLHIRGRKVSLPATGT
ncbi:class I SAM-dependent methyltransferase [Frankia sp. AgPm24]|uniref:class I SAM-dependent methyltransferase n=1 Tax=Frankia sp. AgPm24 TaxID=631128 RepID=UPI00200CD555|nr:class I SAM-dependent methyltransferase [Frankia sp. AgPm24]MCK9920540.1 class I SAM-dependent methyltransferase [Frankia sp. AgPm24]